MDSNSRGGQAAPADGWRRALSRHSVARREKPFVSGGPRDPARDHLREILMSGA